MFHHTSYDVALSVEVGITSQECRIQYASAPLPSAPPYPSEGIPSRRTKSALFFRVVNSPQLPCTSVSATWTPSTNSWFSSVNSRGSAQKYCRSTGANAGLNSLAARSPLRKLLALVTQPA